MKKILVFCLLICGISLIGTSCKNDNSPKGNVDNDHKGGNDSGSFSGNAVTSETVTSVSQIKSGINKFDINPNQIPFNIYCINTENSITQTFLTTNCWIIDAADAAGNNSFLMTPATVKSTGITIADKSILFQQDNTGLCPQACDIVGLLGNISNPTQLSYTSAGAKNVNTLISNFVTNQSQAYNAYQINPQVINKIFTDKPTINISYIIMYVFANNKDTAILYQGYNYDEDDDEIIGTTKTYMDPSPSFFQSVTVTTSSVNATTLR